MKEYAIIVAGGKGTRMMTGTPKQFLLLHNEPILMHTIRQFRGYSSDINLIIGLPEEDIPVWEELCKKYSFRIKHQLIAGGSTRFQTVKNCLSIIKGDGYVAVHDGVRPLVDIDTIRASFTIASLHGSAVAAVRLKESIRKTNQDGTEAVDRSKYRLVQTPQTFELSILRQAYQTEEKSWMTDDASVVENIHHTISLFEGSYENIKITTPGDLLVAEALYSSRKGNTL